MLMPGAPDDPGTWAASSPVSCEDEHRVALSVWRPGNNSNLRRSTPRATNQFDRQKQQKYPWVHSGGTRVAAESDGKKLLPKDGWGTLMSGKSVRSPPVSAISRLRSRLIPFQSNVEAAMKSRLPIRSLSIALRIYEGATAGLWLLVGVRMVRTLIRLARMVPVRPSAEPTYGPSRNAESNPQESSPRTGR
jgi:hypothetical protein